MEVAGSTGCGVALVGVLEEMEGAVSVVELVGVLMGVAGSTGCGVALVEEVAGSTGCGVEFVGEVVEEEGAVSVVAAVVVEEEGAVSVVAAVAAAAGCRKLLRAMYRMHCSTLLCSVTISRTSNCQSGEV